MTSRADLLDSDLLVKVYGDPEGWCGVSGSNAGATLACPARLALPQVRTTSEYAERGNALHEFARVVTKNPGARDQALLEVPEEWRATAEGMNLGEALFGLQVVGCEMAFALDVKKRTTRFIGENISRNYNEELVRQGKPPLSRYEIPMSIDLVGYFGEIITELDYKSGRYIGDPAEHWQRRLCATALMFHYDKATAISRVAYIADDGRITPDGHEFTLFEAEDFCDQQIASIDAVWRTRLLFANGIMPTVNPSDDACAYCSAIDSCPYYTNFAKAMTGRLKEISEGPDLGTLSGDELLKVWEDAKLAAKLAEEIIDKRLKVIAKTKPFGNDDYEVSPKYQTGKKSFDASKARGVIMTLLGQQGKSDDEIKLELAKLNVQGPDYPVYTKRKRHLPISA